MEDYPFGQAAYIVTGWANVALMSVCFLGAVFQLLRIRASRGSAMRGQATELLSLRQFNASFIGAHVAFVFGYSLVVLEPFLVWPRLASSVVYLLIVFEIHRDRRHMATRLSTLTLASLLVVGVAGLPYREDFASHIHGLSAVALVGVACLIGYGYGHQIRLIWTSGRTGALSLRMNQFILMMDVSTLAFALAVGIRTVWPVALVAVVSLCTKICILWSFRWVRVSPQAHARRTSTESVVLARSSTVASM